MRRELERFLCAVQFFTRIPIGRWVRFDPDGFGHTMRYASVVGHLVGAGGALAFVLAEWLWTGWLPPLVAIAATILLTGALHEDGLADTADGLGGGRSRAQRLSIMKDSRLGSYGALALIFSVAGRAAALALLSPATAIFTLIAMEGLGRALAVCAMALPYVGDPSLSKTAPSTPSAWDIAVCGFISLWPFIFLPPLPAFASLIAAVISAAVTAFASHRLIGGRTGDTLGAVEQVGKLGFVLAMAATPR